jgi:hypothetical protein
LAYLFHICIEFFSLSYAGDLAVILTQIHCWCPAAVSGRWIF